MRFELVRRVAATVAIVACTTVYFNAGGAMPAHAGDILVSHGSGSVDTSAASKLATASPIKHVVVIFQENVSFDHYFGTYPHAANPPGEPAFAPAPGTPSVNGLTSSLLTNNPNLVQPFRLDRTQAVTCDQNHEYTAEQEAFDNGKMDMFVQRTSGSAYNSAQYCPYGTVMGYYDGNTVTALWNYAQHYAMSDNSFGTGFGPSTPGALNLVSGDTGTAACGNSAVYNAPAVCSPTVTPAATGSTGTVIGDPDQYYDKCSSGGYGSSKTAAMTGRNVGDLLNSTGATWGWFNGGFADCKASHVDIAYDRSIGLNPATDKNSTGDYSAHHESFQYYASTSNPQHLKASSTAMIGHTDAANHQYDLTDFWAAADSGNLPAVSYLKAPKYQDGHAGYSDPLDEQQFLVETINRLQSLPSWSSTAVIISYDDSDGWYDHVPGPLTNQSNTPLDVNCGAKTEGAAARCGYGPRLPLLVISPYAKANFVDHTVTDQASILRFVEDNWLNGARISNESMDNKAGSLANMFDFTKPAPGNAQRLFLDPVTGEPLAAGYGNAFEVTFNSSNPGQGYVYFGDSCSSLVNVSTRDVTSGTATHTVLVVGNDLPSTVGNEVLTPGATYYYETVTLSQAGTETDNNGGKCYQVTLPKI